MESIRAVSTRDLRELLLGLYRDIQTHNSHHVKKKDSVRDEAYLVSRFQAEGLSFLTKTLPLLDDALLKGLASGAYECPKNFRSRAALPLLLRGLHARIFNEDGTLLPNPDTVAIKDLRQLFCFFKKAEVPFADEVISTVLDGFLDVDAALKEDYSASTAFVGDVLRECRKFLSRLFRDFDPHDIVPRHGPGATAGKQAPHEKRRPSANYKQLSDGGYPLYGYFFSGPLDLLHRHSDFRNAEKLDHGKARVILVPKDSKGPRIISAEPLEYQFLQQGLRIELQKLLESNPLTRGRVNFTDQSINQRAALSASADGKLTTIDLSEASDRVSTALVAEIFPAHMVKALMALRTPVTCLPDGRELTMKKYAPMGSSLCFPVEALCFYALARSIRRVHGGHLRNFTCLVYGDDIITDHYTDYLIKKWFPAFDLKVNVRKSFSTGFFRESCGVDAYAGVDVTPTRLRVIPRVKANTPEDMLSLLATCNHLFESCYYRASEVLRMVIQRKLKTRLPLKLKESAYMGLSVRGDALPLTGMRYRKSTQCYVVRAFVPRSKKSTPLDADGLTDNREYFRKLTQGWSPEYTAGVYTTRGVAQLVRKDVVAYA